MAYRSEGTLKRVSILLGRRPDVKLNPTHSTAWISPPPNSDGCHEQALDKRKSGSGQLSNFLPSALQNWLSKFFAAVSPTPKVLL